MFREHTNTMRNPQWQPILAKKLGLKTLPRRMRMAIRATRECSSVAFISLVEGAERLSPEQVKHAIRGRLNHRSSTRSFTTKGIQGMRFLGKLGCNGNGIIVTL